MASTIQVVKTLRAAELGEKRIILAKICKELEDEDNREQYIQTGLVETLRDLSSCNDLGVCSSVLGALNLLAHNNMQVKISLLRPTGFLLHLINFCCAWSDSQQVTDEIAKSHLHVHELAAGLLRKLVLSSECMQEVASLDLIKHIVELCGIFFDNSKHANCCLGVSQYPPRATSYLHDLSTGKRLIGKVREFSADTSKNIVAKCKQTVEEILSTYGERSVLSVDLYDTTTDQDIVIRDEMVKEGLAWPQFIAPEKEKKMFVKYKEKEDFVWADVIVTRVLDGGHFWAHVGGEVVDEKLNEIRIALQKEELAMLQDVPQIGELVCYKTMVGGHLDIHRCEVLEVLPTHDGPMVEVFDVDYGCRNVVAADSLRQLPAFGQMEPFQARFCCLAGVQPPPSDVAILENTAGILRNLAYRSNACRLQILERDGVDALMKLLVVPDKSVCIQAVGAVLNLSANFKTRARIGYLGGIKILLDIIQRYLHKDVDLVWLAVGAIRNLMLESPINRGRVADCDGFLILIHVYFSCTDSEVKQQCLGALKNLVGNSWYMLTGTGGTDLRCIVDDKHVKPSSLSSALGTTQQLKSTQRRCRRLRPGEVKPKPIEKSLPSHVIQSGNSSCEDSEKEARGGLSQEENTDGDTNNGEKMLLCPSPVSDQEQAVAELRTAKGNQNGQGYYVQGQLVPFCEDELHEFRECKSAKGLSSAVISRPACAFMNAGKGGTVYLGVKKSRIVCGIEIARKDRDRLRLGVDELLGAFKPAVKYDKYQVDFVPVAKDVGKQRRSIEFIPDVFVVEVILHKCSGTVYCTNKNRCYFRCGATNTEFSMQDLRKWVIRDQEALYNKEIKSLKIELSEARQQLAGNRR